MPLNHMRNMCTSIASARKKILFIGMNPSPSGMCQTGIPFGEINAVKNWLKVCETVEKPTRECPNRPVLGFSFQISEVSGLRLWGLFRKLCVSPEQLFKHSFVNNYCPLAFFNENGVNIPSAQLTVRSSIFKTEMLNLQNNHSLSLESTY